MAQSGIFFLFRLPKFWARYLTFQRKVFLALFVLTLSLLVLFVGLSRWGLQRSLGDYAAEVELSRLDWLALKLERAYADRGASWQFLEDEEGAWFRFQFAGPPGTEADGRRDMPPQPPDGNRDAGFERGPGPMGGGSHGAPPRFKPPPLPGGMEPADMVFDRTVLLAADGRSRIVGNVQAVTASSRRRLTYQNQLIGYLAIAPLHSMATDAGRAFLAGQSFFIVTTGCVGGLLALSLSWWLSGRWLRPIRELIQGADAVAQGQLATVVPVRGHDELSHLCETFNGMTRQLQAAQAGHRRWLADIAHELRTPLAAMRAEIEATQDGVRPYTPSTAKRLHRQVTRLGQLVEDLRASMGQQDAPARRESGVNPFAVLLEALSFMAGRFQQVGMTVDTGPLPRLADQPDLKMVADPAQMHQVFINLLENALQYTRQPGVLQIHASLPEPGQARIVLDDTPPGPSPADMPHLFERLYRGDTSRGRSTGGSGLGLAICRAIVEAHGGTIAAGSCPLGGLRVELFLPLHHNARGAGHVR
jgi:two-component system sensor histidine kinase BaeS